MKNYLTELIGTFLFVLTIGLVATGQIPMAPLAIGAAFMVMVYMGAHISGAHYNPAVTLGVMMRGKISTAEGVKYWVAQIVGGILAALLSWYLRGETFAPAPGIGVTSLQALLAEIVFTFALVLVVLQVSTSELTKGNSYYGLAIGFAVFVGVAAAGDISGAALNPAAGIGLILVDSIAGDGSFGDVWLYIAGPLAGGALAAIVYRRQGVS